MVVATPKGAGEEEEYRAKLERINAWISQSLNS
jgi:hypothetical protein